MEIQNDNIERVVSNLSLQITFKDRYDTDNMIVTVNIGDWVQVLANRNGERVVIKGEVHNILCDWDFYGGSLTILIRNNYGVIAIPVKDIIDIHFNKNYSYPIELEKEKRSGRGLTNPIIFELDGGESNDQ